MNVLVLHGPTLQALGHRPGDSPGLTLTELDRRLAEKARALGHVLRTVQSNHEGALVDALWEQRAWAEGVLLNPGPLALGSHVLRAAVAASTLPVVEVLLVPAKGRAGAQRRSVLKDVCAAHVAGAGAEAYLEALERLARARSRAAAARTTKTLGRGAEPRAARAVTAPPSAAAEAAPRAPQRTPSSIAAPSPASRTAGRTVEPAPAAAPAATARGKTLGSARGAEPAAARPRASGPEASAVPAAAAKTLGRGTPPPAPGARRPGAGLTRAEVRDRIADRLSGRLTLAGLATWARGEWVALQRGAAVEAGQRDQLEEVLQALFLAVQPRAALSDAQLVEWMAALE
jgi:3-dehydroquinate dehydratase-2